MTPLRLDLAPRVRHVWVIGLLVAAAALVLADSIWLVLRTNDELSTAQLAQSERRQNVGAAAPSRGLATTSAETSRGLVEAEQVAQRLAQPWDPLFQAIEGATTNRVALLAVEPDVSRSTVAIAGEAADHKAVIEFMHRLNGNGRFQGAHLLRHELRGDDPQRPIVFTLQVQWRPQP